MVPLGIAGVARDASFDGSVIVGARLNRLTDDSEAFRWTASTGAVTLGDLPGEPFSSEFRGVSADGSVAVGRGNFNLRPGNPATGEAVRWTEATGMVGLGDLPGGIFLSQATAVSADGSVVAGLSQGGPTYNAFIWTQAMGMVPLSTRESSAVGISANGRVVVGQDPSTEPFRWTQETGMVGLGHLPGAHTSAALAVSADGSIIVGRSGFDAFIWTERTGMQNLETFLSGLGADVTGVDFTSATAISDDGRVIAGYGEYIEGQILRTGRGWVAYVPEIPEPPTYLLAILCLAVFPCLLTRSAIRRRAKAASKISRRTFV
jgi:probable HAF family extracellular repeat protein